MGQPIATSEIVTNEPIVCDMIGLVYVACKLVKRWQRSIIDQLANVSASSFSNKGQPLDRVLRGGALILARLGEDFKQSLLYRPNYCHTTIHFMDKVDFIWAECSGWWRNKGGITTIRSLLHLRSLYWGMVLGNYKPGKAIYQASGQGHQFSLYQNI